MATRQPVDQPVDVSPFFDTARAFVTRESTFLPINFAVLDDWNGPKGSHIVRIVYGTPSTAACGSRCETCPIFRTFGEDPPRTKVAFSTALTAAEDRHREVFGPDTQRFLNCKTADQYSDAYVRHFIKACLKRDVLEAELRWVRNFRLLLHPNCRTMEDLLAKEQQLKEDIVVRVLQELRDRGDQERAGWIREFWRPLP